MTSVRSLQRQRDARLTRQRSHRHLQLERLEERRLLAGLQLAGIASNQGTLVTEGDIYNVAPKDLVFRFNDGAVLDEATLEQGIEIIRSGSDGTFESASVRTDLNTNGQVIVEFTSVEAGRAGNGIRLEFTKNNRGPTGGVGIEVSGSLVRFDLNTNAENRTTAAALRNAVNAHPLAGQLIRASIFQGNSFTDVATPAINYSPLIMNNANKARGSSDFNLGNVMEIEFTAVADGVAGNGYRITFSRADQGGAGAPRITVNNRTINIELNTHPGSETTAAGLVTAVNTNPVSNQIIRARQVAGQPNRILTASANVLPVTLQGANDVVLVGGFVGYGDFQNEAIFRFAEPLVDDVYRINVIGRPGEGRTPIQDTDGNLFLDGQGDFNVTFELDLAPQVLSVVPQPVERQANGTLVQRRNQIHVYFNNDDLDRTSAENPVFYQLIKTQDTARNTDDIWFYPTEVSYDPALDRAILTFASPLEQLDTSDPGAATFRLRIGTAETIPLAPVTYTPATDPGTSFNTAYDLAGTLETGTILSMRGGGAAFQDGQTFTILSRQGTTRTFEFNNTLTGPTGVAPGNVAVNFTSNLSVSLMAQAIANAINNAGFGVQAAVSQNTASTPARTVINLTGEVQVSLGMNLSGMTKTSQALIVSGTISNEGSPYELQFPGGIGEPGHRDLPVESHFVQGADSEVGITTAFYNFQSFYGFDPQGNVLQNAITAAQRQRVREIFELYGHYLGIQFVESATQGMTIAVGDLRALNPDVASAPGGVLSISVGDINNGRAVMDLQDFSTQNDEYGGEFFQTAMRAVGRLLGMGANFELPPITIMGHDAGLGAGSIPEPVFPGDHDIVHGQHLYRPESKDIDLFRFEVPQRGLFTAETIAERLPNSSLLDTVLTLYRDTPNGPELVARNDDYFSRDSYIELELEPGTYFIGVSASGNNEYDPTIEDTGIGGTTEGNYQLRLGFRGEATRGIVDADVGNTTGRTPTLLDGNADGTPGGVFNFWFNAQTPARTVFVDKLANASVADGSAARPYKTINAALQRANQLRQQTGEQIIVRIVGNGGADNDITTLDDNVAYEIGFSALGGSTLVDGPSLDVPRGVTVMIDAGVIIKARRAYVGVGSLTSQVDRSAGALQVLGVPRVIGADGQVRLDQFGQPIPGNVIFTSLHDTIGVGSNPHTNPPPAEPGDWGGIIFAANVDNPERNRFSWEREGIFLNSVYHADLRYGGGTVVINGTPWNVDPVYINDSQPTVAYSEITRSNRAAISATPNSFAETNFHAPPYQLSGAFTSDYARIGPDITGNRIVDNTLNGLFIRTRTNPTEATEQLTVAGRFDDTDIVHILQENLRIAGNPGGPRLELVAPPTTIVTVSPGATGGTLTQGTYNYILTFVDASGNESPASNVTRSVTIPGNPDADGQPNIGTIQLANLPTTAQFPEYVGRRIYRSAADGSGPYTLVAQIDGFSTTFTDNGTTAGGTLVPTAALNVARLSGRLRIDAGTVLKSEGAIIEVGMGANLISEGDDGNRVVMTSLGDVRYGAGGTFATTNNPNEVANQGDWGGIFAGPLSRLNLDHTVMAYGGGFARVEGDFRNFNALEIHQAQARVANSVFEFNANGFDPSGTNSNNNDDRFGRGFNRPGVIFVRGSQPVIVENTFLSNDAAAININVNALNHHLVNDLGRATGRSDVYREVIGNHGPLISGNRLDNNTINGMEVRGGAMTTEGVWDDTDIVHVVRDTITVPNFHTYGGLRLQSSPTESLVVKLQGSTAGFTATGTPLDIIDRIGGSLQITGFPGFPVVLTSLRDDSVGAGLRPDGTPQTNTNNQAIDEPLRLPTGPEVNRGTLIDNDVDPSIDGFFSYRAGNGGENVFLGGGGVTATGRSGQQFVNQDFIFDHLNFVDVGINGQATNLGATTITTPATLIADDFVISEGTFQGENGLVRWRAESFFEDGVARLNNRIIFSSDAPLGNLRFINYLDEDVFGISDDILYVTGTPGEPDFRAFTLDGPERIGFSQGGIYQPGPGLVNATYDGWAADRFNDLQTAIRGPGTQFTVAGNINQANLPPFNDPDLGLVYGPADVTTAFAWSVDPTATTATVTSFLDLIPSDPSALLGLPGDWRSVLITPYAHDRNVEVIHERESPITLVANLNDTPSSSEFLGELAAHEKAGDDNARLGFIVYGNISEPSDVDVYRFTARGGTEVWFDIDRTTHALDSVVELITADEVVLARSTNSFEEGKNPSLLHRHPSMEANSVNPLQKSDFEGLDHWSTNPRDAGMRVVLPGASNTLSTFYVRVRSNSPDLDQLDGGLTQGSYQLQIRLRETDEIAGTTVRHADLRFATNAIHVLGNPMHSPLTGEAAESATPNNTLAEAQPVGNFMATDRGALGIAGTLSSSTDVDFFQFQVEYVHNDPFPNDPALLGIPRYVATIFDMDYADGLGRANTLLSIFDENGNLVLMANNSNIAEDQPGPLRGAHMDDLSRGSAGPLDPYLGSVMLPVGTYYAAVSSIAQVPAEFGQFSQANPVNPLVRLEPVNSTRRIAEDRIGPRHYSTAELPVVPILFDSTSPVPFTLSDLTLYVSRDPSPALLNQTDLFTVNPMTGQQTTQVGRFNQRVGDIALRWNGDLMTYQTGLDIFPRSDAGTGLYFQIDTGTAAITELGASGIETHELDITNPPASIRSNPVADTRIGDGIHFEAITFAVTRNQEEGGFAVGHRPPGINRPGVVNRNLLYEFVPTTGVAFSFPAPNRGGEDLSFNAGTQIVERGRLVTDADPLGLDRRVILAPAATTVSATGIATRVILDGTRFEVDDGTDTFQFEFVSGPEVTINPGNISNVRDGDTFFLDGVPFEIDTGEVLIITALNGSGIQDGDRFTITDNQPNAVTRIFEWDDGTGPAIPGNIIPVPFDISMTQAQLVQQVVAAINSQTAFDEDGNPIFAASAQASGNRISLLNSSGASENSVGMNIEGNTGRNLDRAVPNPPGTVLISIEEVSTIAEFGESLLAIFNGTAGPPPTTGVEGITVGVAGTRANWLGASNGDFGELVSRGVFVDLGNDDQPSSPTVIAVPFLADDTADEIAQRMADAVNSVSGLAASVSPIDPVITLAAGLTFTQAGTDDPPLQVMGSAPGGDITGLATLPNNTMWAVTDQGGLYQVVNFTSPGGAQALYVQNSRIDLEGINFQGLTEGPRNVEGGRYANMLFGIDGNGRMYAFEPFGANAGRLQPVFANGATSIDTGLTGVHGIAFSNLDINLWHTTTNRSADAGHGRNAAFDASRIPVTGGSSLWFGWESQVANGVPQIPRFNPVNNSADYNFPGGAHGSLISNPFSLVGYAPEDQPMLYFNYFLETENASAILNVSPPQFMRDSFRVFVGGEDGEWFLLATNNSGRGTGAFDDEYDDFNPFNGINIEVQELYDINDNGAPDSWRQARISLADLAGMDNLRLRFDFSTAGEMDVGAQTGTGSYLHAVEGSQLRDGQRVLIGNEIFEFNMGVTLVAPTGGAIQNGQTFTINGNTFEFDSNGSVGAGNIAVPFQSGQSGSAVALEILRVLQANPIAGVTPRLHDNRVHLDGATNVTKSLGAAIMLDGAVGSGSAIPINVHADMTQAQVAAAVQLALAGEYSNGVLDAFKIDRNRIQIFGQTVVSPGPLGLTNSLMGDQFGSWNLGTLPDGTTNANNPGALRAQNNNFEGVYIDDIIIGFAERGEMVTGTVGNSNFITNPDLPRILNTPVTQNLEGAYQLEIRRGEDYGIGIAPPTPMLLLQQSFDTNDRLAEGFTLIAPKASEIADGQTFRLSDGTNSVVFEFEDTSIGNGVAPGHIPIPFNPVATAATGGLTGDSEITMARRIRDAINSAPAQAVINVRAGLSDGRATGTAGSDHRVNLYGNVILGNLIPEEIEAETPIAEPNDTLRTATPSGVTAGVTSIYRASGEIGNNPNFVGFNAGLDVDLFEFHFTTGTRLDIDLLASQLGSPLNGRLRLFNFSGTQLATSVGPNPSLEYQIAETGTYYLGISSSNNANYNPFTAGSGAAGTTTGFYELEVQIDASGIEYVRYEMLGDANRFRDQGQLLIHSNRISNSAEFGINIDAGERDGGGQNPHQGAPRVTREVNAQRLVPGVVIENNVVYDNISGAIRYSGDPNPAGQPLAAVPFGRILNNTLVGGGAGTGVLVENNASPTLLNNIITEFAQGISVDATSNSTVIGGTLYKSNTANSNVSLGSSAIVLGGDDPLFRDRDAANFYLAPGSRAIDSGINSLNDRPAMTSVRAPLGIAASPIVAPARDIYGQLRTDDPSIEPPPGSGENPFIDRGAIDRADFAGPVAFLIDPRDNDPQGVDLDPRVHFVTISNIPLQGFAIQLRDGIEPLDPANGVGVDDRTVTRQQITLLRNGVALVEGVDYRFRYDATNKVINLTPVAGIWQGNSVYVIQLANRDQWIISAPAGDEVNDGDSFQLVDQMGNSATFEYESGYVMFVPETLSLRMPAAGGGFGGMTDGQTFTVNDGTRTVTFEFDNNGQVADGNVRIIFTPTTTAEEMAQAVVAALAGANIGLEPRNLGQGVVHVGTRQAHTVNTGNSPGLIRAGSEQGGVADGETFQLDDGTRVTTFEFDRVGGVQSGNIAIPFQQRDTHEDLGVKIAEAISNRSPVLDPVHLGNGIVHVGGTTLTVLDTEGTRVTQAGLPGVESSFGILVPSIAGVPQGITDGTTFQIGTGVGLPSTFEFDTNNNVVPGHIRVPIPANPTLDQVANAIAQAVTGAALGLTPFNAGNGRVLLSGETPQHFFNPLNSSLTQLGTPGVAGSIPVPFLPTPDFTAGDMAELLTRLINENPTLFGVIATQRGDEVVLEGVSSAQGILEGFVGGILDLAGNPLQANRPDGTTQFTIQLGAGLDFGSAPQILGYPTRLSANGARHEIVPGFLLGERINVDVDGPLTAEDIDPEVDDNDGVVFGNIVRGYTTTITVTAAGITGTRPGFLDAWIDFNADGDWDDPGEQILTSFPLVNGENHITIAIPNTAALGDTYARFRLSSVGGLAPTGLALDGEVEDYRITIGSSPWQNAALPADVNGDGRVNPFDVLLVVAFLRAHGSQSLPVPPPFVAGDGTMVFPEGNMVDVDGSGSVTPFDALIVVAAIQDAQNGEGEGEGEAADDLFAPLRSSSNDSLQATTYSALAPENLANSTLANRSATTTTFVSPLVSTESAPRQAREVTFRLEERRPASQSQDVERPVPIQMPLDDLLDELARVVEKPQPQAEAHDAIFAQFGQ